MPCRNFFILAALLAGALNFTSFSICRAAIYSYTDANGVVHFTNVPSNAKYRLFFGKSSRRFTAGRRELLYNLIFRRRPVFLILTLT